MSTSSRSSASDENENGPSRKPRPGVTALPNEDQQGRQRPEHPAEGADGSGEQQRDPVGVLATQRPRADAHEHIADDHHDRNREQRRRASRDRTQTARRS